MSIHILHTNDFHGTLTPERAAFLRDLNQRSEPCLYFDTGDCIKTGNLGVPMKKEKAWELLALAACDASVLGNRETHVLASAFKAKLEGSRHPVLCANLRGKDGSRPLPEHAWFSCGGLRVGVFGVMVPMVTERMATKGASFYLWDPPLATARRKVEEMRGEADLLIALTHIGFKQDQELSVQCPEIDLILGGHSHTVLPTPVQVGETFICQGGSHGKWVGEYVWESRGVFSGRLTGLNGETSSRLTERVK